ncbi:MAG: tyrosine-protein phosphatase [Bacteroidales bacterium]|nr:tyrosine-protein phosphatase [Bacteroidales bacterium]
MNKDKKTKLTSIYYINGDYDMYLNHSKRRYIYSGKKDLFQERVVILEGSHNLRDVGGLRNSEGKHIKKSVLYRSDKLSNLTTDDLIKLERLGINKILDFRSINEINLSADRMPREACFFHRQTGVDSVNPNEFNRKIVEGEYNAENFTKMMIKGTQTTVDDIKDLVPMILKDILSNKTGTTLYHCAGGKDHTGIITAIILSILEVEREVIFRYYLYTNIQRKSHDQKKRDILKKICVKPFGDDMFEAMKANRKYLQAAFTKIDSQYGGLNKYVKDCLSIDNNNINTLKNKMLEQTENLYNLSNI